MQIERHVDKREMEVLEVTEAEERKALEYLVSNRRALRNLQRRAMVTQIQ